MAYKITQLFGENPQAYKRFGVAGHTGIDLATPMNTKIYAPFEGYISTGYDKNGYGKYIKLRSIDGLKEVIFAHLNDFSIYKGQVKKGEQLGFTGNTGNSTGSHLHLELRKKGTKNSFGGAVNIKEEEPNLLYDIFKKGLKLFSQNNNTNTNTDTNTNKIDSLIFQHNNQYNNFFYKLPISERLNILSTISQTNTNKTDILSDISPNNPIYYLTNKKNYQEMEQNEKPQFTQYPQPPAGTNIPPQSGQY